MWPGGPQPDGGEVSTTPTSKDHHHALSAHRQRPRRPARGRPRTPGELARLRHPSRSRRPRPRGAVARRVTAAAAVTCASSDASAREGRVRRATSLPHVGMFPSGPSGTPQPTGSRAWTPQTSRPHHGARVTTRRSRRQHASATPSTACSTSSSARSPCDSPSARRARAPTSPAPWARWPTTGSGSSCSGSPSSPGWGSRCGRSRRRSPEAGRPVTASRPPARPSSTSPWRGPRSGSRAAAAPRARSQTTDFTATLMKQPAGQWLVALLGLAVIGVGVYHVVKGWRKKFLQDLETHPGEWIVKAGRVGYIAKGIALAIVGGLFVLAAVRHKPSEAKRPRRRAAQPARRPGRPGAARPRRARPHRLRRLLLRPRPPRRRLSPVGAGARCRRHGPERPDISGHSGPFPWRLHHRRLLLLCVITHHECRRTP